MICPKCKRPILRRDKGIVYVEEDETVLLEETHYCSYCNDYFTTLWSSGRICWEKQWTASDRDGVIEECSKS